MTFNPEKLARLQAQSNARGKGIPRRKVKKAHKLSGADDKKIQSTIKKLSAQTIASIDEVNFFMQNGSILHFTVPKIQTVVSANTYIISGNPEEKDIAELLPGILSQLGPENIAELRKMAQAFSKSEANSEVSEISEKLENANTI